MVDGTYYFPADEGIEPRASSGVLRRIDFVVNISGGSGSAKAYVEAYDGATWHDVSTAYGASFYSASAGESRTYLLQDTKGTLSPFRSVRIKVVLDTGGANDGDASVTVLTAPGV